MLEPQGSGRIHYHLLIPVNLDAHDGTDLYAWENRHTFTDLLRGNSTNPMLKAGSN